ncbi:MAG: MBL fold metallo-hydrolase [Gammaproteobacteria bacterium PRO9]|nr:MBL fold metallo-hydrolase [Gammaproteobacteria bacterium PRO9]
MRVHALVLVGVILMTPCIPASAADKATTAAQVSAQVPAQVPATASRGPALEPSRVVLLGTGGGPIARVTRSQPASLLQVGGRAYLIDVGAGTARQVVRAKVRLSAIDTVFLTHLHLDHTAGLMGFLALDWMDRREVPVSIFGPPGTWDLVAGTLKALEIGGMIYRLQIPGLPPIASVFTGHDWEVSTAREVYRDKLITVRAVENSHYDTMHMPKTAHGIDRSYSYRFDLADRSIVFTGDTGPSRAVEQLARGADLLVTELIDLDSVLATLGRRQAASGIDQKPAVDHMEKEHLTPENIGRLAAAAGVKQVVISHIGTLGTETINREAVLAAIHRHYTGPVAIGEDLDVY